MKSTVILIPSYEPDELLINTIKELKDADFPILLVNDGSSEEFDPIFDKVKTQVAYFSYEKNKGKGFAMKYGYKKLLEVYPEAKFVITADGDGQHNTKDIIRVHEELERTNHLVFGVRNFDKDVPAKSLAGNNFSKATRSLLTKTYIQDDQCGLRGFPVRYIPELIKIRGDRYEYEMNEITLFQLKQYPMVTIPIETVYLDSNSRSHFRPFKDTMRIQRSIVLNSFISLFSIALFITGFMLIYPHNWLQIKNVSYNMNLPLTLNLTALASFAIYYLLMSIFYPTKMPFRRLWKELLFLAIRIYATGVTCWIFIQQCHLWYQVIMPIAAIGCCAFNILFAWVFRKLFKTF
ncbi:MAG: glycosyltransferase family 2 protein [Bacilli bacterium]|nr:glycosyltransferase family 2 protein [Bacilli bacterium]